VFSNLPREEFCAKHALDTSKPIVALLPGSRHKEIARILPPMLETAAQMTDVNPAIQFIIASVSKNRRTEIESIIKQSVQKKLKLPDILLIVAEETREALNASDAAAVTSGTATLETAIIGTPMVIVYKTSRINYKLLRPLISVEHFGLINLIARERLAGELIQDDFMPEFLAEELFRLLDAPENKKMRERLRKVADTLGKGGASKRAAQAILKLLGKN
ncbi:MAG TPA: hypothetical protein VNI84_02205, partial [Pyrinomonadaceae bacterium]|nr:hypothetical protein [Pyrinomonadaceae bacterium]